MGLVLQLQPGEYAICRLAPDAAPPAWADSGGFSAVTRTPEELSIICPALCVPADVKREDRWRLIKFQGPFGFGETGVLASVLQPLADARIGILAVSSFDTDHLLVKQAQLDAAITALTSAGHTIRQ